MKQCEQDIEQSDNGSQASLNVGRQAVTNALEITDHSDHGQGGLHRHAFIPGAFGTQFEVGRDALGAAEAQVREDNALTIIALDQGMKVLVMRIERGPLPIHHLALSVEQPAQLDAYRPASFILAFLADLLRTASLPNGKEQFNRTTLNVDHL